MKILKKYIVLFIITIVVLVSSNINWGKNWQGIIQSDGKGYYSYLPAVFIYDDLNFGFFETIEKKCFNPNTYYDYRSSYNGKVIDKYYAGTAVAMLPFFLAAHGLTKITGQAADGYSYYYHVFTNVSAIFYLLIGLIFLSKLLKKYGATDGQAALILLAMAFGTNIFYYTVIEPSMSHVYSFAFVCLFLFYVKKFIDEASPTSLLLSALSLGMIVLIRPVNVLIIGIIPFLAGSFENFKTAFFNLIKRPPALVLAILTSAAIVFIQFIIYKIQTGKFFIYSYSGEGFNWSDPHFTDILFSYKKGLFIYLPVTFLSLAGFIFLYKKSKFRFFSLFIFLITITYVLSSWWSWYYGGSFGLRAYIEFLPVFALLMWYALDGMKNVTVRTGYAAAIVLCILVCQFQTYQYRYYFIHWSMMNKERYWNVFMRADLVIARKNPNADLLGAPAQQ